MSPSRRRRNAKRMAHFITAKLAEIQLKKEAKKDKKSKPEFQLSGHGQSVFRRQVSADPAWLKRKAEQEEALKKIEERRRKGR